METGVTGEVLSVNVRGVDHAVSAGRSGDRNPCADLTRQNFLPAVRDLMTHRGSVSWKQSCVSFVEKLEVDETWTSYPDGCGLGTCAHYRLNGSVTVAPSPGLVRTGGGPMGLL